jgi:hypothetical protein
MHRPARWPSPRKSLGWVISQKKTPALFASGVNPSASAAIYLLVEQVLEIIFTLFTVNVDCVPEEAPAPVAPALLLLGLEELEPEADELLSLPIRRT